MPRAKADFTKTIDFKALAAVEGVQEANVDLEAKKATVKLSADVADDTLKNAVEDAGYTAVDLSLIHI